MQLESEALSAAYAFELAHHVLITAPSTSVSHSILHPFDSITTVNTANNHIHFNAHDYSYGCYKHSLSSA